MDERAGEDAPLLRCVAMLLGVACPIKQAMNGLVYPSQEDTMIDDHLARAHCNNIRRYRLLLQTNLTEFERQFVQRRLSEEQSKLEMLVSSCSGEAHCDQSNSLDSCDSFDIPCRDR